MKLGLRKCDMLLDLIEGHINHALYVYLDTQLSHLGNKTTNIIRF